MSKRKRYDGWINGAIVRPFKAPEWWSTKCVAIAMVGRAIADNELNCTDEARVEVYDPFGSKIKTFVVKITAQDAAAANTVRSQPP